MNCLNRDLRRSCDLNEGIDCRLDFQRFGHSPVSGRRKASVACRGQACLGRSIVAQAFDTSSDLRGRSPISLIPDVACYVPWHVLRIWDRQILVCWVGTDVSNFLFDVLKTSLVDKSQVSRDAALERIVSKGGTSELLALRATEVKCTAVKPIHPWIFSRI